MKKKTKTTSREQRKDYLDSLADDALLRARQHLDDAIKGVIAHADMEEILESISEATMALGESRGYLNARADAHERVMP